MSEIDSNALEVEAPVNPYSLLEAVNASTDSAHKSWLIFLGLMSYLLVAVAGVSHTDLLLNNQIPLPIVQVKIALRQFFLFAPIVLVLLHLGVIMQLVMLARKAIEFDNAMRLLEVSDKRGHPLRLELHNFFFVQAIAGPMRSRVMSLFLHMMTWLTLAVLPVLLLLFIQTMFLPYHDVFVTGMHRVALVADAAVLILIGVFLVRAESSFFQAFFRSVGQNPFSFLTTTALLGAVIFFSFFIATIPGEFMSKVAERILPGKKGGVGFSVPFLGASADGSLFGVFRRNLYVTDLDLVVDTEVTTSEATLNLRGRDLRFAKLDRSDLHQADFTGADLEGASLEETVLDKALFRCVVSLGKLLELEDRKAAECTTARGANFSKAKLSGANMLGINLTNAKFEGATLERVDLKNAIMPGVDFSFANLKRADISAGAALTGANFELALMHGVDLDGAALYGAKLNSAELQGAKLSWANLEGANLSEANLDGTDLTNARLQGADLTLAKIRGADLRGALIWKTKPPASLDASLADLTDLRLQPMEPMDTSDGYILAKQIGAIGDPSLRNRVSEALAPLFAVKADAQQWTNADKVGWQNLVAGGAVAADALVGYRTQVTTYLGGLMCNKKWLDGAVATGIVRQAGGDDFRGDKPALYERLQGSACLPSRYVPAALTAKLATAADGLQGQ